MERLLETNEIFESIRPCKEFGDITLPAKEEEPELVDGRGFYLMVTGIDLLAYGSFLLV